MPSWRYYAYLYSYYYHDYVYTHTIITTVSPLLHSLPEGTTLTISTTIITSPTFSLKYYAYHHRTSSARTELDFGYTLFLAQTTLLILQYAGLCGPPRWLRLLPPRWFPEATMSTLTSRISYGNTDFQLIYFNFFASHRARSALDALKSR